MQVEIAVTKGVRAIGRVNCSMRSADDGEEAFYRGIWWPVRNGAIDIANLPAPAKPAQDPHRPEERQPGSDPAQEAVIHAEVDARIVVAAGPGTGKTWVACRRVSGLIANGIPASRIWMISFTRTAVVEIRQRIAAALEDPADAASVRIATLDSHAWSLQYGFATDAALTGSFDEGISRTVATLTNDPDAADYLGRLRHLVIDEGQDIVGIRQDLILAMVDAVDDRCGVTAFIDDAQAIYDFTEEARGKVMTGPTLGAQMRDRGFQDLALSRVHRTDCPKLKAIFTAVRSDVLDTAMRPERRAERVRAEVVRLAHADAGEARDFDIVAARDDALVLFRRRADCSASAPLAQIWGCG